MEALLTLVLVGVILGTASGARNIGLLGGRPLVGAAVGIVFVLRGPGGVRSGTGAAQDALFTEAAEEEKPQRRVHFRARRFGRITDRRHGLTHPGQAHRASTKAEAK